MKRIITRLPASYGRAFVCFTQLKPQIFHPIVAPSHFSTALSPTKNYVIGKRRLTTMSTSSSSFYDFKPLDKTGNPYDLSALKGKVVLVVNTASKCGFTPQFESLESLSKEFAGKDFVVLGFPCNQFGSQDPGSNDEIQQFCKANYGVTFPVLGKVDVNGKSADPLWEWLKQEKPGLLGLQRVKWNFEKFLIGKDGKVKGRWASTTKPESLKSVIEEELQKA